MICNHHKILEIHGLIVDGFGGLQVGQAQQQRQAVLM
jgi:hypothetical protein